MHACAARLQAEALEANDLAEASSRRVEVLQRERSRRFLRGAQAIGDALRATFRSLCKHGDAALERLAAAIRDPNFRLFAEGGEIHLVGRDLHLASADPFEVFAALAAAGRDDVDPSHAFYLGYEMAKAVTALSLDKDYRQDQALDWGHLTRPEIAHGPSRAAARVVGATDPAVAGELPRREPPTLEETA